MHSAIPPALLALSTSLLSSLVFGTPVSTGPYSMEQSHPAIVQSHDDASITRALESRLAWQGNTRGIQIRVSCNKGVVTLSGTVLNNNDFRVATETALHTPGVRSVDTSSLRIGSAQPVNNRAPLPAALVAKGRLSL
ncbi:BON domain-containing protein [Halopseudomonas oceani]|uniref:BON domain-containing protein n=1 Tax=Halopseudomonas oceani TaxID=1708783 RepID=UPI002AA8EF4A|nr:BON domain-containing protein [Halopseudomonas oceani]